VAATPVDVYVAAFLARCDAMRSPGQPAVSEPGVHGVLASSDAPLVRLLVTDDRAYDLVVGVLPDARAGMINVLAAAERCAELVGGDPAWRPDTATAMVCRDLGTVPELALPSGLRLRPVRRLPGDPPDGVSLECAIASAAAGSPAIARALDAFADYLRSLPPAFRLFVAVDGGGAVRATAGSGAFGEEATAIFVNTQPEWRGRGVGRAMTAAALRSALQCGARRASLDASDAGSSIYLRLGFEAVTRTTRFFHTG
jgi:GNAT superfamily N-acetyltransferase